METLQSVLLYGRYEWQPELQPLSEFQRRLVATRQLMRENGWDALAIYGDSRENAALSYLTNIIPNQRWSLALLDAERPPCVIAAVGPRDLPSVMRVTWIEDVRPSGDVKAPLSGWLRGLSEPAGKTAGAATIAVAGLANMRASFGHDVSAVCGDFGEIEDPAELLWAQRRAKSPNELALLRKSYAVLQGAFAEIEARRKSGAGIASAVVSAERAARLAGAQDVRSLCSAGGRGPLGPVAWMSEAARAEPWSIYLAVRYCGYWTEGATTLSFDPSPPAEAARACAARAAAAVRPGVVPRQLLEAAKPARAALTPDLTEASRIVRAHGLSLDAEPWLTTATSESLVDRSAYIVMGRAVGPGGVEVIESASVFLDGDDRTELWPIQAGLKPS